MLCICSKIQCIKNTSSFSCIIFCELLSCKDKSIRRVKYIFCQNCQKLFVNNLYGNYKKSLSLSRKGLKLIEEGRIGWTPSLSSDSALWQKQPPVRDSFEIGSPTGRTTSPTPGNQDNWAIKLAPRENETGKERKRERERGRKKMGRTWWLRLCWVSCGAGPVINSSASLFSHWSGDTASISGISCAPVFLHATHARVCVHVSWPLARSGPISWTPRDT